MYQVILKKTAQKSLKKVDKRYQARVTLAILELAKDPLIGKRLEGELRNFYSLRVWPYRVVYYVIRKQLIIVVVQVKHRQAIYR